MNRHKFSTKSAIKSAFSTIELVFVIALLGVLILAIPSSLHLREKSCYATLASSLSNLQERLSLLYTDFTLHPKPLSAMRESSLAILSSINASNTPNCALEFAKNRLVARANGQSVAFSIEPNDFSEQPAFKCNFTTSPLCRKILERTKIR